MIYLDSSALLKLLFDEPDSEALADWLTAHADEPRISSELVRGEVVRAARRLDSLALPAARSLLTQLDLVPLSGEVVERAAELGDPLLRTLDALHLASALSLGRHVSAFVAYDRRLLDAARTEGFSALQPGA